MTSPKLLRTRSTRIIFTNRTAGNLAFHVGGNPKKVAENRRRLLDTLGLDINRLTTADQVHGARVVRVTEKEVGSGAFSDEDAIPATDALVTNLKNTPLVIFLADCLPIILVDCFKQVIGVVHAGREGVYLKIVPETIKLVKKSFASSPGDILAFIGPGIGPCCYPVDLREVVLEQLESEGISKENIYLREECTSCQNDLFFSYRKEKTCGRQAAIAAIL